MYNDAIPHFKLRRDAERGGSVLGARLAPSEGHAEAPGALWKILVD